VRPDLGSSSAVAVVDMVKERPFGVSRMAGSDSVPGGCMHQVAGRAKAQWEVGIDSELAAALDSGFWGHHSALPGLESGRAGSRTF